MSSWDETPLTAAPTQAPKSSWDATPLPQQVQAPTSPSAIQNFDTAAQNAAYQFTDAFGHNIMKPYHAAAMFVQKGIQSGLNQLPANQVTDYWNRTTESDREELARQEAEYQKNVPNTAASYTGAVTGAIAPYVAGGAGELLQGAGKGAANLLPNAAPNIVKSMVSSGTQGALIAPTIPITSPDYWNQFEKNLGLSTAIGTALPLAAAPFKWAYNQLKGVIEPVFRPETTASRVLDRLSPGSNALPTPEVPRNMPALAADEIPRSMPPLTADTTPRNMPALTSALPQSPIAPSPGALPPTNMVPPAPPAVPQVPGYKFTTAQTQGGPDLIAAEKAIRNNPELRPAFDVRDAQNNMAIWDQIKRFIGSTDQLNAAKAARDNTLAPLRTQVLQNPVDAQPLIDSLDALTKSNLGTNPTIKRTATGLISGIREGITNTGAGGSLISPDLLDGYRQNVGAFLRDNASGVVVGTREEAAFVPVKNLITDAIDGANPGYRDYLAKYAQMSQPINSMEAANAVADHFANRAVDVFRNPRIELTGFNTALNKVQNLDYGLSPEADAAFEAIRHDLQASTASSALRTPGSDTVYNAQAPSWLAKQLYGENLQGGALAKLSKYMPFHLGSTLAAEPAKNTNTALVNALLNPDYFAQITTAAPSAPSQTAANLAQALRGNTASTVLRTQQP